MTIHRKLREQSGGVLVTVAVTLPLLVLLGGFVIDTGNWWVHKRHLQIQADAAALAAAGKYRFPLCEDATIAVAADQYGGIAGTPTYNEQIGAEQPQPAGDNDVTLAGSAPAPAPTPAPPRESHLVLNQESWYDGRPDPADAAVPLTGSPCADKMVDVKMTETDVPWFFKAAGVDYIDAQARVALRGLTTFDGMLPVGVEDVNPKRVRVVLFDEDTGVDLAQAELGKRAGSANGLLYFDNAAGRGDGPMTVDVHARRIGVRVVMSGSNSVTCGDALVLCYGYGAAGTKGVARVRGYTTDGTGAALREVVLTRSTGCVVTDNGYFSAQCTRQTVNARVDGLVPTANPRVEAVIAGSNQRHALTYDATSGRWTGSVPVTPLGAGARSITIEYEQKQGTVGTATCSSGNSNPCKGQFGDAHSTFTAARPVSGPIKALSVGVTPIDPVVAADGGNVERCAGAGATCRHAFTVEIGIGGRLELAEAGDPPVSLRVFSGSQNQSLDCDPDVSQLDEEIANGCDKEYTLNGGQTCPHSATALWQPQPPAWNCVAVQTGTNANAPARGLNLRVYGDPSPGGACPPDRRNFWPDWQEGDRRIMPVFVVPFGSFDGSGSGTVPVIDFAFFYVTGWTSNGNGFRNPCKDDGDVFVPGTEGDSGAISGHFLKYVSPNTGGGGTEACDPNTLGGCVAVLVK